MNHTRKTLELLTTAYIALKDLAQEASYSPDYTSEMQNEFREARDAMLELHHAAHCDECHEIVTVEDFDSGLKCCADCAERIRSESLEIDNTQVYLERYLETQK